MYNVYIGCKPKKIVMRTQIIQKLSSDKSKLTNMLKQNTLSCTVVFGVQRKVKSA